MQEGRNPDERGDAVWRALANATRRRMLDELRGGPRTTGELAEAFPELSRFAVMQHLRVLQTAELVTVRRDGRRRYNYLNPVPLREVYARWVGPYMQPWAEALVSMRDELENEARGQHAPTRTKRSRR
ncbi:MAG TPA: metalloregulator ArsR/SmtB family transcription factor [Longimicrobiales bacterium]|nr:metalloregulator ArsR/SmtB family transcription factor [Longimicrobiales bacterium]